MPNTSQRVSALQLNIHFNRKLFLAMLFSTFCTCTPCIAANEVKLVLNDPTEAPYTTPDGTGFFDIIAREAFHRAGLKLTLIKLPAERGLINANAGIDDGDLSRIAGIEKKYTNLVRVPEKLMNMDFVAFARQSKPSEANWANLADFSVGYIKGWKIFENNLTSSNNTLTADNPEQLLTLLDKNRIDVALYDRWMGMALLNQMHIKNVRVVEPPLAEREMFIYLHKRHESKIPAIVAALRAIKSEGLYTKICREKFGVLATSTAQCEIH